ncbi:hypothetical protein QE357_002255 [Siphonobacter sp. BAB-5404]|nr:hypothetical protein [Siphonobacter sp. SORGH_AS_0500]
MYLLIAGLTLFITTLLKGKKPKPVIRSRYRGYRGRRKES